MTGSVPAPPSPACALPITALRDVQDGRCAGCGGELPATDLRARNASGWILGLVCKSCSVRRSPLLTPTPYDALDSLTMLRLRVPHHLGFPRSASGRARLALAAKDWDFFESPTHALWVQQRGRCPLPWHGARIDWRVEPLVLDHDHLTGLARALLCHRCNVTEGKARRGTRMPPLTAFRLSSPAQQFAPTRWLSHAYLTRGGRA